MALHEWVRKYQAAVAPQEFAKLLSLQKGDEGFFVCPSCQIARFRQPRRNRPEVSEKLSAFHQRRARQKARCAKGPEQERQWQRTYTPTNCWQTVAR